MAADPKHTVTIAAPVNRKAHLDTNHLDDNPHRFDNTVVKDRQGNQRERILCRARETSTNTSDIASTIEYIKRRLQTLKSEYNRLELNDTQTVDGMNSSNVEEHSFSYEDSEVPVLYLLGQSNIDGRGTLTDIPNINVPFSGEVKIWNKPIQRSPSEIGTNHVDNGAWKDYEIGDMVTSPVGPQSFGPELQIAIKWRDMYYEQLGKKPLYIIKCAIGGTSLKRRRNSDIDQSWDNEVGSLRNLVVDYFARPAIQQLKIQGLMPKSIGFIWGQGESDAKSISESAAYFDELSEFIPDIVTKIGFPDTRVLIMGLSNACDYSLNWVEVKIAQMEYALKNDNAVLISTDGGHLGVDIETQTTNEAIPRYDLGKIISFLHYSSAGLITLGSQFFDALDFSGASFVDYVDNKSQMYTNSSTNSSIKVIFYSIHLVMLVLLKTIY